MAHSSNNIYALGRVTNHKFRLTDNHALNYRNRRGFVPGAPNFFGAETSTPGGKLNKGQGGSFVF